MKYIKIFLLTLIIFMSGVKAYYEAPVDITKMDVYELQDSIDKGYLTYELLIRLYLDRIEAYDKDYKAIISINKNAIEEAKKCDIEFKENGRTNILWCMPIIVKDNIDVKGLPTTVGSKALADSYPNSDAYVVKKLKEKGMIVLAKANMSAFAFQASSSVSYYGTVHNAYNLKYSSYGSSGGSAVSVAVQYAPFALGTDTNASVRAPASANNLIGFRPTLKLIDTEGIVAYDITRDVVGPITKTVEENALLMSAMTGNDYTSSKSYDLSGKKIAVLDQFVYSSSTYSGIKTLFDEAIKKIEEAGATIIHLKDFYKSKYESVGDATLGGWTMCYAFNKYIKNTSSKVQSFYQLTNSSGNTYSLWEYYYKCNTSLSYIDEMENKKTEFRADVNELFKKYELDAIVYPNSRNKLLKIGTTGSNILSSKIAPVLGLPAVAVQLGFDSDGLPYGMEVMGLKNTEDKLYQIIYAYEMVNSKYELPSIAPALYSVSDEVNELKKIYEANIKYNRFTSRTKEEFDKIAAFFVNYNDYDEKEEEAKKLYTEYITILESDNIFYNEEDDVLEYHFPIKKVVKYLIIILLILLAYLYLFCYKKKRKKKKAFN